MSIKQIYWRAFAALTFWCAVSGASAVGQEDDVTDVQWRLQLVRNSHVQQEIEVIPIQREQIESLDDDAEKVSRRIFSGMRRRFEYLTPDQRSEVTRDIRAKIAAGMQAVEDKLEAILVPDQLERLDQIILQELIRREGTARALKNTLVAEKLKLTREDLATLANKEIEIRKKLEADIKKLRAKAEQDIVSALPTAKQNDFKLLVGEKFEVKWPREGDESNHESPRSKESADKESTVRN